MPPGYQLDPGEVIVQRLFRSPFYLVPLFISSGLIVLAVLAGVYGYGRFRDQVPFLPSSVVFALAVILITIVGLMLLSGFYVYRRNYLVITNMHVIKSEQNGLFNEVTSQLDLARVQDVTGSRSGVFGTIFNYGDIVVETAGAEQYFIFRYASGPQRLADQLLQDHEDYLKANPTREIP
jgi:uncharacterized membrane protein YdbT with pleckstrin-like domain